jgi:hypothetical protein
MIYAVEEASLNKRRIGNVIKSWRKVRNAYKILGGKPEVKNHFGRPKRRWNGNTKIYIKRS